ncbi:MAG: hypothetical protein QOJ46_2622 [bacterium]|jgi:hypothetical protein
MDTTPPCASGDRAIAGLVTQMLQTTATLTVMVDEMMRFEAAGQSSPDSPPVIDVLGRLLCDVLPALLANHPPAAIEGVTDVLRDADTIMCRDLCFVPPESMPANRQRRPRTPRPRPRR